jgi:putative membrane protein
MYVVGVIGHLLEPTRNIMLALTPLTLLFTGGLVLYAAIRDNPELIRWSIFTYLFTFIFELFGVKTGYIFGNYSYGDVLIPQIWETPLIIGFNWVLVILGSIKISKRIINKPVFIILAAPVFAVLFDFILEPVAVKLGYWNWENGIIPLQNYLAWYVISFLFTSYFVILKIKIRNRLVIHYYLIQIGFFMILNTAL